MATPNPLQDSPSSPSSVSVKTIHIGGILTDIYGLGELPPSCRSVSCIWLLHPRLQTKETMANVASSCINDWNHRASSDSIGLIAVAFDQRNHGSRCVKPLANEAWRGGNVFHSQDMWSIITGTAQDTTLLIDHIGAYILNGPNDPLLEQHFVLGISLGGHAAWQVIFNEPRVTAAVVIIGCPDYMRMMSDRARLSKLKTYTSTGGIDFFGSTDFPKALISSCENGDPKAMLFGAADIKGNISDKEQNRVKALLDATLKGKHILVCSGGDDKLVPYHCSEPFLTFLKQATSGWYKDGDVYIEDNVYSGVGHAYSKGMVEDTTRFVSNLLASSRKPAPKI
ncbi:uncharacterized protein LY89DRAFT_699853 [Mollisia scopiformis]|uniref:Uncharacterized protein n=1 Tax=Mollisia scopiformis TaxID=149040 RepID=A0A194WVV1_MOLSC|nr:uncharacterized protein LY89DRAFT_699853 [Mollisia scopiformis]KUJ11804.1 hypothetical protein LY89DRAFT_699853 [Mollisia scopiformis]